MSTSTIAAYLFLAAYASPEPQGIMFRDIKCYEAFVGAHSGEVRWLDQECDVSFLLPPPQVGEVVDE